MNKRQSKKILDKKIEQKMINVYQVCEGDAVAATCAEEAKNWYKQITGITDEELYSYEEIEILPLDYEVRAGEDTEEMISVKEILKQYWKGKPFIAISEYF